MAIASRLQLEALKGLVLRHMQAAAGKGLYQARKRFHPSFAKMPPGLARIKREHEAIGGARPAINHINFVFSATIPRMYEQGVFGGMSEKQADGVINQIVDLAAQSVMRAQNMREMRLEYASYMGRIYEFFTEGLLKYSGWIKRKMDIREIVIFKSGLKSEDEQTRLDAIRRVGEVGMVEATEDLIHILRTGSNKEKLAVIEAMQTLKQSKLLVDQLNEHYKIDLEDLSMHLPEEVSGNKWLSHTSDSDGNIYLYEALGEFGKPHNRLFWMYDPAKCKWTNLSTLVPDGLLVNINHKIVGSQDGKIYFIGGDVSGFKSITKDIWSFNPKTGEWRNLTGQSPEILSISHNASFLPGRDGKIYMLKKMNGTEWKEFWSYDPKLYWWKDLSPQIPTMMSEGAEREMVFGPDGHIYLLGDHYQKGRYEFLSYDPKKGKWKDIASRLPAEITAKEKKGRSTYKMITGSDGNIYLYQLYAKRPELWSYNPFTRKWADVTDRQPKKMSENTSPSTICDIAIIVDFNGNIFCLRTNKKTSKLEFYKITIYINDNNDNVVERVKKKLKEQINGNS